MQDISTARTKNYEIKGRRIIQQNIQKTTRNSKTVERENSLLPSHVQLAETKIAYAS